MRVLYIDCFSGISGDMLVGALSDAGVSTHFLEQELSKLNLVEEYELRWSNVVKKGIAATKFDVILKNENDKPHRHYKDIAELIANAGFSDKVTRLALDVFERIGRAEANIHNVPLEKVHFHEVGAIDSIVDIVLASIAIDSLNIDVIISSPIPVGNGKIRIDHGLYPIPAPATLEMLKGIPIQHTDIKGELTTPTGAAFVSILVESFGSYPNMIIEKIGYGAGTKDFEGHPNVLRVAIGRM